MAGYWYVDRDGGGKGPVEADEIARLVRQGDIRAETLLWAEGMAEWAPAGGFDAFAALFAAPAATQPRPPVPRVASAGRTTLGAPTATGGLVSNVDLWPLLGRGLLAAIGSAFVIPAPWTSVAYWKYLGETTALPNGTRFFFDGRPADIWWVFVLQGLLLWTNEINDAGLVGLIGNVVLPFLVLRWFCAKLRIGAGGPNLSFDGPFLNYLGWVLLFVVSMVTVVGWAWVAQYYLSWACRNVSGPLRFEFAGKGLEILWRTVVGLFGCAFIIPIPWVLAWLTRWFVSQIEVVGPGA